MIQPHRPVDRTLALANKRRSCYSVAVGVRSCSVTFTDGCGVRHTVDVTAESLFEAAALALATLKGNDWTDPLGPATPLEIEVRNPAVRHTVTVLQIQRWIQGATSSPNDRVKKDRLARLLSSSSMKA